MLRFVQQLLPVMLAMDIQQAVAQRAQLRDGHGTTIQPAGVFAVGIDLPLQQPLLCILNAHVGAQPLRYLRKHGADKSVIGTGADQFTGGALPQNGAQRINNDGLSGAGFTGQRIEARAEGYVRLLNDGNILNMQQIQHIAPLRISAASF